MTDYRAFQRQEQELSIVLNDTAIGRTKNVGLGGALCSVNQAIAAPSEIGIRLQLPDGEARFRGRALRCTSSGERRFSVAVRFSRESMDELAAERLAHLSLERSPHPWSPRRRRRKNHFYFSS